MSDDKAKSAGQPTRKRSRWLIPAALAAGVFFLITAPLWAPLLLKHMAFFRVRHVEVLGARYAQPRDILARMKVDTLASVWDGLGPWERRVAQHPLVREVRVERKLPGTLVVRIVEFAPVALVATPAGFRAYDERGRQLAIDPATADVDAPVLAGPDSTMFRLLGAARTSAPDLYHRVSEVRREADGTELLLMLDSLPVHALADVTLQRLADVPLVEHDLARRGIRPAELDLRYRDQVIARLQ